MNTNLDLFKLHLSEEDNTPKKWLRVYGKNLPKKLEEYVASVLKNRNISRNKLINEIIKKNNCGKNVTYSTLYALKDGKDIWIPLIIVQNILEIAGSLEDKPKIQEHFEFLQSSVSHKGNKMKAVPALTIDLCKIAGAHAADGCLTKEINREGFFVYRFEIGDQNLDAMHAFRNWLFSAFGINLNIIKKEHKGLYMAQIKNKIWFRYLHQILGFSAGEKTYTVRMPEIIRKSDLKFRNAFVTGALTFEAGVNEEGTVAFRVASKRFTEDLADVLRENKINTRICEEKRGFWSFKVGLLFNPQPKIKEFFEPGTLKYYKVHGFLNSFDTTVNNLSDAIKILDNFFGKSTTVYRLSDVLNAMSKFGVVDFKTLFSELRNRCQISERALRSKLNVLQHLGCINKITKGSISQRVNFKNIHSLTHISLKTEFLSQLFNKALTDISLNELAEKLKVNSSTLQNWRFGSRGIPFNVLQQLLVLSNFRLEDIKENLISISNKDIYVYNANLCSWHFPSLKLASPRKPVSGGGGELDEIIKFLPAGEGDIKK